MFVAYYHVDVENVKLYIITIWCAMVLLYKCILSGILRILDCMSFCNMAPIGLTVYQSIAHKRRRLNAMRGRTTWRVIGPAVQSLHQICNRPSQSKCFTHKNTRWCRLNDYQLLYYTYVIEITQHQWKKKIKQGANTKRMPIAVTLLCL